MGMTCSDSHSQKVTLAAVGGMDWTERAKTAVGITIRKTLQTPGEGRGWIGPELQQCAEDRGGLEGRVGGRVGGTCS